ncbi:MAG TPA: hypothetical protein DHV48_00960 [Prolixibacteraceae bacterium]|nr:hypothetical protein [Prolixibacteraceae bacterium]
MRLEKICHINSGGTPSRGKNHFYGGDIPWAKISDIENSVNGILTETEEKITEEGLKSIGNRIFPKGTLLFAMYGSIGKVAITGRELATNQAILGIRPKGNKEIYLPYLKVWFESNKQKLINQGRGVALQNLSATIIRNLEVPLPSFSDQLHIANILSKAENLITQRKQSIALLDEYLKSTFLEMFGDPVRNEKGWKIIPFTKSGQFNSGGTPSKAESKFWEGTFPWLSPKDMKVSTIKDSQDHISDLVFKETNQKRIAPNHLLIVVRGMILAHSFPLAINTVEIAINQDMKAIKPIKDLNIFYFQHCLHALKRQILDLITSAGHGTKRFDSSAMQMLNIPIPPLSLQTQFAQIVEKTGALKVQYQNSLLELENLYGSLSQRAFRGELTLTQAEEQVLMAAEPEAMYGGEIEFTPKKCDSTERVILAGHIINKTNKEDFGRVKFQKLLHLTEYFCKIDIDSNFSKNVAGPHDRPLINEIESTLERYRFYDINQSCKGNHKVNYRALSSVDELEDIFNTTFESERERIDAFLSKFRKSSWEQCEIISTLYAVWNNRLILNQKITDDLLKQDFLDWDAQKIKYMDRLDGALQWMEDKGVIPVGWGKLIK